MGFPRNDFIKEVRSQGHSESFLSETLAYADVLDRKGLPVIFDRRHLAFMLNVDPAHLYMLVDRASRFYKYFAIKKRSGGLRRIMAPYQELRRPQEWIKNFILDKIEQPRWVTAFAKGRNTMGNAKVHEGMTFVLKVDIKNFFESIDVTQVYKAFRRMGYEKGVASCLASLTTAKIEGYKYDDLEEQPEVQKLYDELKNSHYPFLIQGAPTSPALANIVCYRMDRRMMGLANKYGFNYTRYADDMTFSAGEHERLPKIGSIKKIVESEGFRLNEEKTQLLHEGNRMFVTGLLVDGHVRVPGIYKKDIMRHIHFCQKYGGRGHFHWISPGMAFGKEWLEGRIRYVHSIEPEAAKKMWDEFEKIDWMM